MKNLALSKDLMLLECVSSQTATRKKIDNTPSEIVVANLKLVATKVFQPVRDHFKKRIRVSSGYRSAKLNAEIGGSKTSQHMTGEALDLQGLDGLTNKQIYDYIKSNLDFDQLIWEYGTDKEPAWVHVSFKAKGNRKQVLRIK